MNAHHCIVFIIAVSYVKLISKLQQNCYDYHKQWRDCKCCTEYWDSLQWGNNQEDTCWKKNQSNPYLDKNECVPEEDDLKNLQMFVTTVCWRQNDFRRDLDSYQQLCDNCNKENCSLDNKGCNLIFLIRWSVRWLTTDITSTMTWVYIIVCVYQNWTYQVDTIKHCHWYSCCWVNVWYFYRMLLHCVTESAIPFFSMDYGSAEYKEV